MRQSPALTLVSRWLICVTLAWLGQAAQAAVTCPALFNRDSEDNTYYALVFLGAASEQRADRLVSQVTPMLSDIARKLSERSGSKNRLRLKLIACQQGVGEDDFSRAEMKRFLNYKVVAVFWKNTEGDKPGLVQLAVPVYLRGDPPLRSDMEVVTLYASKAADPVDGWIEVFSQDAGFYKPFVAMGLATVYQQENDFKQAWAALCDSRIGLTLLARDALRPKRELLDKNITEQLAALMDDLALAARKVGIQALPACTVPAL
jgi:hypothetical protein